MNKILKYSFFDLIRSRWTLIYLAFYMVLTFALLALTEDTSKVVISLMNIILLLVPLIASMFSVIYSYNSREFVELLLAQPIPRSQIFLGQYLGVATSLAMSYLIGVGVPFLIFGVLGSAQLGHFVTLLVVGLLLSFIFAALAFLIALRNDNKLRGFGLTILVWLFFAVIYDGIFLVAMMWFRDYPLDNFALGASLLNPIDLSRILIMLKLDIAALLGYTGAVFQQFFGSAMGVLLSVSCLLVWIGVPVWRIYRISGKRDF